MTYYMEQQICFPSQMEETQAIIILNELAEYKGSYTWTAWQVMY